MRLFIALQLTPAIHIALNQFVKTLRAAAGDSVRWVDPANIHLTLKFLGEVDDNKSKALIAAIAKVAGETAPFDFSVLGTGVFPGWDRPRIVWAGTAAPADLKELQAEVDSSTRTLGFPSEARPFSPHFTLGRVNGWMSPSQLGALHTLMDEAKSMLFGSVHARQVTIFKSTLRPTGAVYTPVAVLDFARED